MLKNSTIFLIFLKKNQNLGNFFDLKKIEGLEEVYRIRLEKSELSMKSFGKIEKYL